MTYAGKHVRGSSLIYELISNNRRRRNSRRLYISLGGGAMSVRTYARTYVPSRRRSHLKQSRATHIAIARRIQREVRARMRSQLGRDSAAATTD